MLSENRNGILYNALNVKHILQEKEPFSLKVRKW